MRLISNWGFILLAVYLIIVGLGIVGGVAIPGIITGVIALISGVLILIGR